MRQIGKYQVQEQIGVGGFGEVFKGFDPFIKRNVAIKTCSSRSEEIRSRFFQEAEISGNLNHKNITTIHDFGVEGDLPYLVQEYLSGEDLDEKIRRRDALPYAEKLFYLIQITRGLGHAHRHGVIHRDIKPANVRILEDGTTKIMDFGIAKLAQHTSGLTQTGMTLGTAAYLSPEQIRGEAVDPRTDIFSFGVLAYELLTYERPFKGEQISAVLYQLLHHDPRPIDEIWPEVPSELATIITRCLAKDPEGRFQDAATLLRALEGLQWSGREGEGGGTVASPAPAAPEEPAAADPGPTLSLDESMVGTSEVPTLDDIEISTALVEAPEVTDTIPVPTGQTAVARPSKLPTVLAILLLAAVAGFGGWWFGARPGASADAVPPGPEAGADADENSESGAEAADGETIDVEPTAPDQATQPETPAPKKEPKLDKGRVIALKPAWTDKMTVRLGKNDRALVSNVPFTLAPGRYELTFSFTEGAFVAEKSVSVQLGEGSVKRVAAPIEAPGAVTVRPQLGGAQGQVLIDGLPRGTSPLNRWLLEPGSYLVEFRAPNGQKASHQLALASGSLAVLTFSYDDGTMTQADKPLKLP